MPEWRYRTVEDTVWPVDVGLLEWVLRYGQPQAREDARMFNASVVEAYRALVDPNISQKDAIAKLKRARAAQKAADASTT